MAKLIHYSENPLTIVHSVKQINAKPWKPNGLWVSVEGEDDWPSWCRNEGFFLERLTKATEVILSKDANVLWLKDDDAIDKFSAEYAFNQRHTNPMFAGFLDSIRWGDVAKKWQGLIIAPYSWRSRLTDNTFWYYGWDCASGCIWDATAIAGLRAVEFVLLDN